MKVVTNPLSSFLRNFCATLLISSPTRLRTKSITCNILVLGWQLSHAKPSRVMIVTLKPITKLGFGFDIML